MLWAVVLLPLEAQSVRPQPRQETAPRVALVRVSAERSGSVLVTLYLPELSLAFGEAEVKSRLPGCDWRPVEHHEGVLSGRCWRWLPAEGSLVEGRLHLANLVEGLHGAGANQVDIEVTYPGLERAAARLPVGWTQKGSAYRFSSVHGENPPHLTVRYGRPPGLTALVPPLLVMGLLPGVLLVWTFLRGAGEPDSYWPLWSRWAMLGAWLYWITVVDTADVAELAGGLFPGNNLAALLVGAALFALPPLCAVAGSQAAACWRMGSRAWLGHLIQLGLAVEAAWLIPLALFLVSVDLIEQDWRVGTFGILAAWVCYRWIGWMAERIRFADVETLHQGRIRDRALALAERAGVSLEQVQLLRNKFPQEVNAYALPGNRLVVTESLLERLNSREVDAVIAHELGHLRKGHSGKQFTLLWLIILFAAPLAWRWIADSGAPQWIQSLPLVPLGSTLAMAAYSRRHELAADAQAVAITADPEAHITALAKLPRLTRTPLNWGGIQGSLLSHPSVSSRVLAIARRFGVPETRALQLLDNPDAEENARQDLAQLHQATGSWTAKSSPDAHAAPEETEQSQFIFSSAERFRHSLIGAWFTDAILLAQLFLLSWLIHTLFPPWQWTLGLLVFLFSLPIVFSGYWLAEWCWEYMFMRRMEERLRQELEPGADAWFAGVRPGEQMEPVDGSPHWDLGFLYWRGPLLTYVGERTAFSLARKAVASIELACGPPSWMRDYRVLVRWSNGCFSLGVPYRPASRDAARSLYARMERWLEGGHPAEKALLCGAVYPPPVLPEIPPATLSNGQKAWALLRRTVKLFVLSVLLVPFLSANLYAALTPVFAPLLCACAWLPKFFRSKRDLEVQAAAGAVEDRAPLSADTVGAVSERMAE